MKLYLQYLADHWDRIVTKFPGMVDKAAQMARQTANLQNRLPDAYAVLAASQELAIYCFEEMGLISFAETDRLITENNAALLALIQNQAEQVSAESPVRKFFTAIANLLVEGKVCLAPRTKDEEYQPPFNADQIGYYDPGADQQVIYLRTEASLTRAKEFWRGLDENLDIMPDALRRQLRQVDGLLAQVGDRQVEASKLCAGVRQRVLVVDIQKVEQIYGVSLIRPEK